MIGTVGPGLSGVNLKMLAITRLSMYQMAAVNRNVYRAKPLGSEISMGTSLAATCVGRRSRRIETASQKVADLEGFSVGGRRVVNNMRRWDVHVHTQLRKVWG